ncbi:MAG: DUF1282 family protein [Sulfuricella sp.]|nr:DUF1282 family protein [Sulfuricella sp.]
MRQLQLSGFHGWDSLSHSHIAVTPMYLLFALPLSFIPPLMLYYAGTHFPNEVMLLPKGAGLQQVCVTFFFAEQVMLFLMAGAVQRLGETLLCDLEPSYENSFKLAATAATPLWLVPLFLFVPNPVLNLAIAPLALLAASLLIHQGVPRIFRIEEEGRATLYSASIILAGIAGWAVMLYIGALTWVITNPL